MSFAIFALIARVQVGIEAAKLSANVASRAVRELRLAMKCHTVLASVNGAFGSSYA